MSIIINHWNSLERWSPTLFLIGGVLVIGHAAIRGVEAFTDLAPPPDVFGPLGYLLVFLGLLGLCRTLLEQTPKMARLYTAVTAITLVGWIVILAVTLAEVAGLLSLQSSILPGGFYIVHILMVVLTYVMVGVSSLHAGVHSRTTGFLLLLPALLFAALMVGSAVSGTFAIGSFVIGTAQALAHLAIGEVLRASSLDGSQTPSGDTATG